jgi:plasmid stabilization system protein ParE
MYEVVVEGQAKLDIVEAWDYIRSMAPQNADRWLDSMEEGIRSLDQMPRRCALAPENAVFTREIRQLIHGNYRILFTIRKRTVHILHVRHGARRHLESEDVEE